MAQTPLTRRQRQILDFLRAYHAVFPLEEREILFLKEAYRFFLLNYVVREGRFFFRHDIWQHLLHDVVDVHLPSLDERDFASLVGLITD